MYIEYWNLFKKPFENITDQSFFYASKQHREALSRMMYVVGERKPGLLLIGEYGMGKTYLSRSLIGQSASEKVKFVYISNPRLSPIELLLEIAYQFECSCDFSSQNNKVDLLHKIEGCLKANFDKGFHNVIIFDEAQSIPTNTLLEEIRLLLNIQRDDAILFTLLLVGQPRILKDMETLPQFLQRLGIRYHLKNFTEDETKNYIRHRLDIAGLKKDIFTESSYREINKLAEGTPRAINNICDMALLTGFINGLKVIDRDSIISVGKDLQEGVDKDSKEEMTNG
jgi:general secretion pathway protein A